ncbi:MAG: redoxin domain-containing protein [Chloroflexi bacterium]|nr:redoxin domain-containing protein [Chloroflexota bacterium]
MLTVSADMPFALGRFCGAEGIDNTETLTTQRDMQFADDYGVHDTEWRICQRAVFVLDRDNVLRHVEYVGVIGDEVDYDSALAAARALA